MENETPLPPQEPKPKCGIIMPISAMDGYTAEHWKDVLVILQDAIDKAGFQGELVSAADEVNIIQKTIVQNLYNNQVVICDISGRNANVMFELGIRLTFDKPTVIVCDDQTPLPFDTSMIEHIIYPKTLRYQQIEDLKAKLLKKIMATHQTALNNNDYSPFLKHFGEFKVPKLDQKEISANDFILQSINELRKEVRSLRTTNKSKNQYWKEDDIEDELMASFFISIFEFLNKNEYSLQDLQSDFRVKDVLEAELMNLNLNWNFLDKETKKKFVNKALYNYIKANKDAEFS